MQSESASDKNGDTTSKETNENVENYKEGTEAEGPQDAIGCETEEEQDNTNGKTEEDHGEPVTSDKPPRTAAPGKRYPGQRGPGLKTNKYRSPTIMQVTGLLETVLLKLDRQVKSFNSISLRIGLTERYKFTILGTLEEIVDAVRELKTSVRLVLLSIEGIKKEQDEMKRKLATLWE